MFNIAAHLALALGLFWYQKKLKYKPAMYVLTIFWYGAGTLMIFIETVILTGELLSSLLFQGMLLELFYVFPMYLSLKWAKKHNHDIIHPFFMFLVFSALATVLAGWFLANANVANGIAFVSNL